MSRIFDDLPSSRSPATREPESQFGNSQGPHKLAYEWTFWQHFRPTGASTAEDGESTTTTTTTNIPDETVDGEGEGDDARDDEGDGDEETNKEQKQKAEMRAAQYLNGTTLLTFPKYEDHNDTTDTIATVEQFWESVANIKDIVDVPIHTEYFFFKKGIKPLWEDEFNKKGGKWYFGFNNNNLQHEQKRKFMSIFWELLMMKLVSGEFLPKREGKMKLPLDETILDNPEFNEVHSNVEMDYKELNKLIMDDIAGMVISIRAKKIVLSVWNTNLTYKNYQRMHGLRDYAPIEEYNHLYREHLNAKNKLQFESLGLTGYQFRQLIYESISSIFEEAIELAKTKENARELHLLSKHKLFKYSPHFFDSNGTVTSNPNVQDVNKKGKYGKNKKLNNQKNGGQDNNNERFNSLGRVRKKVEFNDDGLMVEELNVLSFRQKWNRKRRPFTKKEPVNVDDLPDGLF